MLFNSYVFIFLFLPVTWALYMMINRLGRYKLAEAVLVICSLVFYGYQNALFALLLIASVLINYGFYRLFNNQKLITDGKVREIKTSLRQALLISALVINLGILFYFKYVDFFMTNVSYITGRDYVLKNLILPLGISFYTFQQISFVVDCYKGDVKDYGFIEYALFVCFFPQLIAGPIVLHSEMVPQFRDESRKRINPDNVYLGAQYFIIGLAKKVLIADMLGRAVDWGYENILWLNSTSAIVLVILYTLQIYFDFSGYCDMAMGIGRLFNLEIVKNFDSPYKALSVTGFWKRWHITLTRFFTTYIYIPLGGNRKGKWRTYLNVMIVFAISGLWHGADWTFVLWGVLHGVMMVLERMTGIARGKFFGIPLDSADNKSFKNIIISFIRFAYTFTFVSLAWVLFRAESFVDAMNVYKRIIHGGLGPVLPEMREALLLDKSSLVFDQLGFNPFMNDGLRNTIFAVIFIAVCVIVYFAKNSHEIVFFEDGCDEATSSTFHDGKWMGRALLRYKKSDIYPVVIGTLFVLAVISLSGVSKFLYFNF